MKKLLALVLASVMVLSLAACGTKEAAPATEEAPAATEAAKEEAPAVTEAAKEEAAPAAAAEGKNVEDLNVWFIVPKGSGIYWGDMEKGAEQYCIDNGISDYTLAAPDETANVQQQIELCEAAVSADADILVCRFSDPEAFMDVVKRAYDEGITIIDIQTEPVNGLEQYIPAWVGISPEMLGEAQAETVIEGVKAGTVAEDAAVFYQAPALTDTTHISNWESFRDTLQAAYPNMTITCDETGQGKGAAEAAELLDATLLANPEITVLVADGANETSVMAAKVEGDGTSDKMYVVGCDGGEDQAEMLYIGTIDCTVCQDTYSVGYIAVEDAVKVINGETVDFYTPVGCNIVYPDGLEEYCAKNGFDMTAWSSYKN